MLMRFLQEIGKVQTLTGLNLAVFLDRRPPRGELEDLKPSKGTYINRNTCFEPLSVLIGPILRPVGWPRKRKKENKAGEGCHKTVIFHHHVEVPFHHRSAQN